MTLEQQGLMSETEMKGIIKLVAKLVHNMDTERYEIN